MNESDLLADNISMLVIFLILNIFDITASANDELRIQFKRIIEEIDGYEELPPCEGLEKLSDLSVHKYPPAPVCHDLFPIYENFLKFDRQMRKDCLALEKMTRSYKVCTAKTPDAQEKIARDYLQRPANH